LHEDQTRGDDEEAEQFKQDEEVSHAGYPVAIVREKENMLTLKSSCVKGQSSKSSRSSRSSGCSNIVVEE
jgi:hypothetical protein